MADWIRKNTYPEMEESTKNGVLYLHYPMLDRTGLVRHAFSTRIGGTSTGIFSGMNFSFSRGDDPEHVRENYRRMAGVLGVKDDSFVVSYQTHTTNLRVVTKDDRGKGVVKDRDYRDMDGLLTDLTDITLVTYYADCIPLFFLDPVNRAIALSHAGWRGTVKGMSCITARKMNEVFNSKPEDLIVCIGPGICRDCYEVDEKVADEFKKAIPDSEELGILSDRHGNHVQLDLLLSNKVMLERTGVKPENIHVSDICTHCNPDLLFSHRSAGEKRGNLAAFLALK